MERDHFKESIRLQQRELRLGKVHMEEASNNSTYARGASKPDWTSASVDDAFITSSRHTSVFLHAWPQPNWIFQRKCPSING